MLLRVVSKCSVNLLASCQLRLLGTVLVPILVNFSNVQSTVISPKAKRNVIYTHLWKLTRILKVLRCYGNNTVAARSIIYVGYNLFLFACSEHSISNFRIIKYPKEHKCGS